LPTDTKDKRHMNPLFEEFPPVSKAEWEAQIARDIKGADPDKLDWKPYEGFTVKPFYTDGDLDSLGYLTDAVPEEYPYVRGTKSRSNDWNIAERIAAGTVKEANRLALESIVKGADAVTFICEVEDEIIHGVPVQKQGDMSRLLQNLPIGEIPIHFECGNAAAAIFSLFINEAGKRGVKPEALSGSVDADPLKYVALRGSFPKGERQSFEELRQLVSYTDAHVPEFRCLSVGSRHFHDSGASATQELAFALASGVEYLDRLTSMDLTVDQISPRMRFSFSVGSNYFMEIAKLRAARLLWAEIVKQYRPENMSSAMMSIETRTSSWNMTIFDPYVNMLRGTVEAMAAAIGGSDTLSVLPFDSVLRAPDEFSRRMARNTQLILKNESYMDRVVDPSSGSYYIEELTDSIAKAAWDKFLKIEEAGGFVEAFRSGLIQREIEDIARQRDMNIATRKDFFLGVNQYPNLTEKNPVKIDGGIPSKKLTTKKQIEEPDSIERLREYLEGGNTGIGDVVGSGRTDDKLGVKPLRPYRGPEAFEEMRLRTVKHAKETGKAPVVFLLPVGNISMRNARANFSSNFFGCAGFKVIENRGFDTIEKGVKAAVKSGAQIVVICSSDKEYPDLAPGIAEQIKTAKPDTRVVIAGYPKEQLDELRKSGVDEFIHARSNALEELRKFQAIAGIGGGESK